MKKQLTKIIAQMFALLIITSLAAFPTPVTAQNSTAQEKTMHFMETILPIDLSKYTVELQSEWTIDEVPLSNIARKMTFLTYHLTSAECLLQVDFIVENGKIWSCDINPIRGDIIPDKQYLSQFDAVKSFLENYQTYAKIDSNKLIAMLDNVDINKNSTIVTENIKLRISGSYFSEANHRVLEWTNTIDDLDYTWLILTFDMKYNLVTITDTRVLYTVGDTSINISYEQAIEIALEGLKSYSYEMPDGSIVKDFKVGDTAAMLYATPMDYVDYILRPYWDVKLILTETAPGNVFGITVFIWANTGEIISYSNMATGGSDNSDNTNTTEHTQNSNTLIIGIAIVAVIAVVATGVLVTKKKHK